jgi:hypothetical protein
LAFLLIPSLSRASLGDRFFSLPNEIQFHILSYLSATDTLSARLCSHALSDILSFNATAFSRSILYRTIYGDANLCLEMLYPPPRPLSDLSYLLQMLHRQAVVNKMVIAVTDFIQFKIYQIKSASRQKQFAPIRRRMIERFTTPIWIIYHFLETYRKEILSSINSPTASISSAASLSPWSSPTNPGDIGICQSCSHLQCFIIAQYPIDHLLPTYQVFKIMLSAFRQKLHPPTYAGSIERRLRGWNRSAASDEDMTKVLILGGMREVYRIMKGPRFMFRLAEMQRFITRVDGSIPIPLPVSARTPSEESKASVARPRPPMMKALDVPDGPVLENMRFLIQSQSLPQAPNALWLPGARSRILKAAIVAGTVETQWAIPDCFTFIQDIIADREARLGESDQFDPNISFEARLEVQAMAEADEDEDSGGEHGEAPW